MRYSESVIHNIIVKRNEATIKHKDQERKLTTKITKNTRELSIINDEL
jgi:hypothetical protein